jgi:hypothetical protein
VLERGQQRSASGATRSNVDRANSAYDSCPCASDSARAVAARRARRQSSSARGRLERDGAGRRRPAMEIGGTCVAAKGSALVASGMLVDGAAAPLSRSGST